MDDRTFKKRCFYVAVTAVATFIALLAIWNLDAILGAAGTVVGKLLHYVSPLIYGFIIAYFINIPAAKLESVLKNRSKEITEKKEHGIRVFAVVLSYVGLVVLIVALLVSIYLMIGGQLSSNTDIQEIVEYIMDYLLNIDFGELNLASNPSVQELFDTAKNWVQDNLLSGISDIGSTVLDIGGAAIIGVISFIISLYFAVDYEKLVARISAVYLNTAGRFSLGRKLYQVVAVFDKTFRQFLRGQFLEAMCVAVMSCIALKIAGVQYFVLIGVIAGICNMIPYVGPWIGAAVAAVVSVLGGGYMTAVWAIVAMIVVQQIDNHLLAPKIVGDSVGLHPVMIMVMLIVGSDIGGLIGILLAVPVAATIKNLFELRKARRDAAFGAVVVESADTSDYDSTDV
ncbi:MAG: AI-2E family transporter [Firmicutes bacterium]|nr:AI-2E family transporter [Bacillota bacterium]